MHCRTLSALVLLLLAGCQTFSEPREPKVVGDYAEACECASVCHCFWKEDATFNDCRGILAWHVTKGSYQGTDLQGVTFAASMTHSGKNVEACVGQLEGVLFLPADATAAQREAVRAMMQANVGPAFSKLAVRDAVVHFRKDGERREVSIDGVGGFEAEPLESALGGVPSINRPPSAFALAVNYCAVAEHHTYGDGENHWDFSGRNSFYGDFELPGE